jgi:hypothetical protein
MSSHWSYKYRVGGPYRVTNDPTTSLGQRAIDAKERAAAQRAEANAQYKAQKTQRQEEIRQRAEAIARERRQAGVLVNHTQKLDAGRAASTPRVQQHTRTEANQAHADYLARFLKQRKADRVAKKAQRKAERDAKAAESAKAAKAAAKAAKAAAAPPVEEDDWLEAQIQTKRVGGSHPRKRTLAEIHGGSAPGSAKKRIMVIADVPDVPEKKKKIHRTSSYKKSSKSRT